MGNGCSGVAVCSFAHIFMRVLSDRGEMRPGSFTDLAVFGYYLGQPPRCFQSPAR